MEDDGQHNGRTEHVRCLIVAPAPLSDDWVGGISNFIRGFIRHAPADFEISVCGVIRDRVAPDGTGWLKLEVEGRCIDFLPVATLAPGFGPLRLPTKARELLGLLAARRRIPTRGRVVQIHSPTLDRAFAGRRAPIIRVVHNAPANLASARAGTLWRRMGWALRWLELGSYRRASRVYFVDRATYEHYRAFGGLDDKLRHLANGVDTRLFRPRGASERGDLRRELGISLGLPSDGRWILFCGRLDRQKDPQLMIDTFAAARSLPQLSNSQLLVVGAGPLEERTRQQARRAGIGDTTHFIGALPHGALPDVMSAADALLLTSAYEATPFVVLESLAAGLPVVSTNVGDVPAIVHHGETGWLATSRSAEELARGLAWAVDQPRDAIAELCAASMAGYDLESVLTPFYEEHRRVAAAYRR